MIVSCYIEVIKYVHFEYENNSYQDVFLHLFFWPSKLKWVIFRKVIFRNT